MTPAIDIAKRHKLSYHLHEYAHDSNAESYGLEAAEKLGVDAERVFKTLVVTDDKGKLAVAVLPVTHTLNLKQFAKAIGAKKATMADRKIVERSTGYVLGGVSPLGQKKRLPTVIHHSAETLPTLFVSAGKRGLEIELPPQQIAQILQASFANIINRENR